MALMWEVETDTGKRWYVGSRTIPNSYHDDSTAQIIIPVEQLGNLTNEQIGQYVRDAVSIAIDCHETEVEIERQYLCQYWQQIENSTHRQRTHAPVPGYIYLIKAVATPWYKVGLSKTPNIRLKQLGAKSPFEIVQVKTHMVEDMVSAEAYWHQRFACLRTNGEWFALEQKEVDEFCLWGSSDSRTLTG